MTGACGRTRAGWWHCLAPWWRRRQAWQGGCVSSYSADGLVEDDGGNESALNRCWTQFWYVAGLGHPVIDVRVSCDVCLVLGLDIRHTFIKGIGVATSVA